MIEMQYKKVFKRYQKSTFDPLMAGASNLDQAFTSDISRNSFRHRRVAPEPRGNSYSESAKDRDDMCADESISYPQAILNKDTKEVESRCGSSLSNADLSTSPVQPFSAPIADHRDQDVVSPVDHQRFNIRVAWHNDGEGLCHGEQSEGQSNGEQSDVWLWNDLLDHDNRKPLVYAWLAIIVTHILHFEQTFVIYGMFSKLFAFPMLYNFFYL